MSATPDLRGSKAEELVNDKGHGDHVQRMAVDRGMAGLFDDGAGSSGERGSDSTEIAIK